MFERILIARRGEAAARVARTCKRIGLDVVGLHSEAAESVHVDACDESFEVKAEHGRVRAEDVLAIAKQAKVDAVYPGYASHTAHVELARCLEAEGLPLIGVDPDVLAQVRDRLTLRELAARVDARFVPGFAAEKLSDAIEIAESIGYPIRLLPPLARFGVQHVIADDEDDLFKRWDEMRLRLPEGPVVVERWFPRARSMEVLLAADSHGDVAALIEGETSIVRDGRGLVRECPSPELVFRHYGEAVREMMFDIGIRMARGLEHCGLLGVQMLLDEHARIYVRGARLGLPNLHAGFEMVTGLDLVEIQLRLASGEPLSDEVRHVQPSGHAIGAQLLAKGAPAEARAQAVEALHFLTLPQRSARIEASVVAGATVPPDDWPRIAKLTCHAAIRHQSLLTLDRLLAISAAPPLETNKDEIRRVLQHGGFVAGQYDQSLAI